MSMNLSLSVGHLHTRLRSAAPIDTARRQAWLGAFAAQDGEALAAGLVGPDEWLLIRRLQLATRWRADADAAQVGPSWGQALRRAIETAVAGGQGGQARNNDGDQDSDQDNELLFYPSRRAAVADLVYRSALGQAGRQWAWAAMGLLAREGLTPASALAEGVHLLQREPALIWPVLQRLVAAEPATAALTASLRGLPPSAWARLLSACPQTAGYWQVLAEAAEPLKPVKLQEDDPAFDLPAAQQLRAWAAARGWFVRAHLDTVALLLAAQAHPGARGEPARRSLARSRTLLQAGLPPASPSRLASPRRESPLDRDASPQDLTPPLQPEAPALPEVSQWQTTRWAGALFWLTRVTALASDELPLLLRELASALGVPDDDAVRAAFCGGLVPTAEAPPALVAQAQSSVRQWRDWLDEAAPDLPEPRLAAVCQRSGRLRVEPGWIELHLPLSAIDTAIRRLGLDLDPGWLPTLGCVVRFVYDDE